MTREVAYLRRRLHEQTQINSDLETMNCFAQKEINDKNQTQDDAQTQQNREIAGWFALWTEHYDDCPQKDEYPEEDTVYDWTVKQWRSWWEQHVKDNKMQGHDCSEDVTIPQRADDIEDEQTGKKRNE